MCTGTTLFWIRSRVLFLLSKCHVAVIPCTYNKEKCKCSWTCIHWMYSTCIKFDCILLVTEAGDIILSLCFCGHEPDVRCWVNGFKLCCDKIKLYVYSVWHNMFIVLLLYYCGATLSTYIILFYHCTSKHNGMSSTKIKLCCLFVSSYIFKNIQVSVLLIEWHHYSLLLNFSVCHFARIWSNSIVDVLLNF